MRNKHSFPKNFLGTGLILFSFVIELSQVPAGYALYFMFSFPCIGVPMAVEKEGTCYFPMEAVITVIIIVIIILVYYLQSMILQTILCSFLRLEETQSKMIVAPK